MHGHLRSFLPPSPSARWHRSQCLDVVARATFLRSLSSLGLKHSPLCEGQCCLWQFWLQYATLWQRLHQRVLMSATPQQAQQGPSLADVEEEGEGPSVGCCCFCVFFLLFLGARFAVGMLVSLLSLRSLLWS